MEKSACLYAKVIGFIEVPNFLTATAFNPQNIEDPKKQSAPNPTVNEIPDLSKLPSVAPIMPRITATSS